MVPYYSVYIISYINISHVISEKVVGYIVSNFVDFLNGSIFHKNIIFHKGRPIQLFVQRSWPGQFFPNPR